MRATVTEQGLLIPKELLEGIHEVEIRRDGDRIVVEPANGYDPIVELGKNPITLDDIDDASTNHDRYIYTL
jgi:virulence-associated protein VagC